MPTLAATLDEEAALEELRRQTRVQYRGYIVGIALVCLIVGGLIGRQMGPGARVTSAELEPPAYWGLACAPAEIDPDATPAPTPTPRPLRVYVTGAVGAPQVVTLPGGSLAVDALNAAGGPTSSADLTDFNLAAPLHDHQHLIVPSMATAAPTVAAPLLTDAAVGDAAAGDAGLININTATAAELQTLPGIGEGRAQDIVAYREEHGPFQALADLKNVPGIGVVIYNNLAGLITVGDSE